uniref:Uncharacterized protein n=1 Tax=Pipistrellus kuhlii TaxID=59472 RepID=A0A7J8B260_PIPKU|nr:hypothetical protein mPipKuh1_007757 [Pipistrellus kuhlii]
MLKLTSHREMQIETTKMQIKTTISHLSEWLSSTNQQMTSAVEDAEKKEPSCTAGGNADWCSHHREQYRVSSKKLKMKLPFDPVIPLLGIYPKKLETPIRKDICTAMFIAVQFTIGCLETA